MAQGLRERRRIETIRTIQEAALSLAATEGAENVTVEAICARAGVSVRTFFNYFPVREAAFVVGPPPFPEAAVAQFLSADGPMLDALIALLQTRLPISGEDRRSLCLAMDMAAREPRMASMQISASHAHEIELADLIAQRMGCAPEDPGPHLLAAATLATTRAVISGWARDDGKGDIAAALDLGLRSVQNLLSR